jgi:hypothetical protein
MTEKKVAIIGKASNSQMLAPYDDESWEIWGLSNAYMDIPRWNVWFELHDWEYHRRVNPEHYNWLMQDHKKPIYAFDKNYHNAPCAVQFPIMDALHMFGDLFNGQSEFKYWTNSPSYMMALAILQGATHIGLWGVDMAMNDEYAYQRPSCELMIGVCLAKGIRVTIPPEVSLCKSRRLYGYETHSDDGYVEVRTRENTLKMKMAKLTEDSKQCHFLKTMFLGALQEIQVMQTAAKDYNVEERVNMLQTNAQQQQKMFEECERQRNVMQGALEDLSWVRTVFLT